MVVNGAAAVAGLGFRFSGDGWTPRPALVNGAAGMVIMRKGRVFSVIGFLVSDDLIKAIDILADQARLRQLDLAAFADHPG